MQHINVITNNVVAVIMFAIIFATMFTYEVAVAVVITANLIRFRRNSELVATARMHKKMRDTLKPAMKIVEDKRTFLREHTDMYSVISAKPFDFETAKRVLEKKGCKKAIEDVEKNL